MKRRLIKFSNYSFCITLPKKAVEQLGWGKGEVVDVNFDPKTRRITVGKKKVSAKSTEPSDIKPIPKLRW